MYLEALEFSPENPEVLTTIGLLYLRLGENYRAGPSQHPDDVELHSLGHPRREPYHRASHLSTFGLHLRRSLWDELGGFSDKTAEVEILKKWGPRECSGSGTGRLTSWATR